jgi:hypothetical protein
MLNKINVYKPTELELALFEDLKEVIHDRFNLPRRINSLVFKRITTKRSSNFNIPRLIEIKVNQRTLPYQFRKRKEEHTFYETFLENIKNYTHFPFSSRKFVFLARRRKHVVQAATRKYKYEPVKSEMIRIRFKVNITKSHS